MEDSGKFSKLRGVYEKQYKKLLIIPFTLLIVAFILIGTKFAATGDLINRDVSLKGGVTVTIPTSEQVNLDALEIEISQKFPNNDITTKSVNQLGSSIGFIVESDAAGDQAPDIVRAIGDFLGRELSAEDYAVEIVGPSLGASFFTELIIAILIAFVFMALVVFAYFRSFIPSIAVVLAAFSDIVVTLAVVNLLGIKLSTAGIAAFLMLIGYSVDTNILLSSRVLKRKEGEPDDRIINAMKTGLTMTATTVIAVSAALLISQSEVIRQIMTILLIGLFADLINTWIQNVGILRTYLKRKRQR